MTNQKDYIKVSLLFALALACVWVLGLMVALSNVERLSRDFSVDVPTSAGSIELCSERAVFKNYGDCQLPVQRAVNHWQGELIQHSAPNNVIKLQYAR